MPPRLWRAMVAAPRLAVSAPLAARAAYLARAYADLTADPAELAGVISRLRPMQAAETIDRWLALAATHRFEPLAAELMALHYDPRYTRQRSLTGAPPARVIEAPSLTAAALPAVADELADLVKRRAGS
jgi:tRNA 2-selenouridine synthase